MKKRIFLLVIVTLTIGLVISTMISVNSFRARYIQDMIDVMQGNINALEMVADGNADYEKLTQEYKKAFGQNTRFTVIAEDGTVVADTQADVNKLENHGNRAEVTQAKSGGFGTNIRQSESTGIYTIYVAKQLADGTVLRTSMPLSNANAVSTGALPITVLALIGIVILVALLTNKMVENILAPFGKLLKAVREYMGGKQETIHFESKYSELDDISRAFEQLSQDMNNYMNSVKNENKKTALVLDSINEGLMVLDEKLNVLLLNKAAKRFFDVETEVLHVSILHYVRNSIVVTQLEKTMEKQRSRSFDFVDAGTERTYRFYTSIVKQGSYFGVEGKGMLVLISDVTEIVKSERVRKDFAANVSHELKTPLTSISGFAQIIENGMARDQEAVKSYASKIAKEADRLMGLINDTLELSSLEQISMDEQMERISLRSVSEQVLSMLDSKIHRARIQTEIEGEAEITANFNRMRELITNLCENAVKYNKPDGMLRVTLEQDDTWVTVRVKDTGIGIPKDEIDRVFERFYRAKNAGGATVNGTGLGLAIVKHIASLYDGEVSVDSQLGAGTTVTVRLKRQI